MERNEVEIIQNNATDKTCCAEVYKLAAEVYPPEVLLPLVTLQRWFERNPQIFWLARVDQVLAGYILAFPLNEDTFRQALEPQFSEKSINSESICEIGTFGDCSIYLSSIVVRPNMSKSLRVSQLLRIEFLRSMLNLSKGGQNGVEIASDAISEKGAKAMQSLGMKPLRRSLSGSMIHLGRLNHENIERLITKLSS